MPFWKRDREPDDWITSVALADFGRYEFLGSGPSGVSDPYALVSPLVDHSYSPSGPIEVAAELRRHAERGEWERVGAWKYVRNFISDTVEVGDLIDGGLLAIDRMRVTNLRFHLAPVDTPRYIELTGHAPGDDGFFGPPVFDSGFGESRQYYFDRARSWAHGRSIQRLHSSPGVEPGPLDEAVRSMRSFGMLIYRGPLVVNFDISFEPNVVRQAVAVGSGVDHTLLTHELADRAIQLSSDGAGDGGWGALGTSRFIEDYLDPACTQTEAWGRVTDHGLVQLWAIGAIDVMVPRSSLTSQQRERFDRL